MKILAYIELGIALFAIIILGILYATGTELATVMLIRAGWLIPVGILWGAKTLNQEKRVDAVMIYLKKLFPESNVPRRNLRIDGNKVIVLNSVKLLNLPEGSGDLVFDSNKNGK